MQIKTTMRKKQIPQWDIYLPPIRMAITKRQVITSVGKDVQKREPLYTVSENVTVVQPLLKTA